MSIHLASASGDGFCLAYRLTRDGHPTTWWCQAHEGRAIGRGLVEASAIPPRGATTIYDAVGMTPVRGAAHLGANDLETWETRRMLGTRTMAEHGIRTPPTHEFRRIEDARAFLRRHDGEFYFKPDGTHVPKSMTKKGTSEALLRFLTWAAPQLAKVPRFELQEPVESGCEVDVAVWLNARGPIAYEVCLEEKKFCTGDLGPATGCQSNVLWDVPACALVADTIEPFIETLYRSGYVGLASINTIITPKLDIYGLEFTMRLGFDSTQAALALWDDTLGDQLDAFARGRTDAFERSRRAAMTLRISTPPQPIEDSRDDTKLAGTPLPPELLEAEGFLPDDVALDREKLPICATGSGFIGTLSTTGTSLATMRDTLLKRAKALAIDDAMWRKDPVSRADKALAFLRKHGLCPDPFAVDA